MTYSIQPNMIPMRDIKQFSDGDRLFYELGKKIDSEGGYGDNWIRTGQFQEIENPKDFLWNDKLLSKVEYIEHHNFMLIKKADMNKEFVPYNLVLRMKALGFDNVPCLAVWYDVPELSDDEYEFFDFHNHFTYAHYETQYYAQKGYKDGVLAPTFSQAFKWIMQFPPLNKWNCNIAMYSDGTYSIKDGKYALHEYLSSEECLDKLLEFVESENK